ncbi:hypothetical protein SAMN05446589_10621 [Streptomyces sp. OV198]|jgi:hypothetical protein|nr:hypothetical protein SAMN05446589_10621 [Streptomyces sp. OV198]
MPGRISEDPPSVATRLVLRFGRAPLQQQGLRLVEVIDRDVEVALLGRGLVRPTRSLIVVDALKTDRKPVLAGDAGAGALQLPDTRHAVSPNSSGVTP